MTVAAALAPVFALLLIGHGLRRSGFLGPPFWEAADRLTYYILFPALLIESLSAAKLPGVPVAAMAGALIGATGTVAALVLLARPRLGLPGASFTSLFQGAIRPNTYVGLAGATALFGAAGLSFAAVAVAALVPLVNVLSAFVLARYGDPDPEGRGMGALALAATVARNPLVLACAAGIALNASGVGLPLGTRPLLHVLGQAALPLGLLSVGAGLDFGELARLPLPAILSAACKLVLLPGFALLLLGVLGAAPPAAGVAMLFAALPTSATSYVMARAMGGDHGLMASIITLETIAAVASLPLTLALFG